MKLLTPQSVKDIKNQEITKEIMRSQELAAIADKTRKDLANAEADFKLTLARNREQWASEEEQHQKRLKEMQEEVDLLEAKRINALVPINILAKSTEERIDEYVGYLQKARLEQERAEELAERLEDKLDEVGEKEQDLNTDRQKLLIKQEGLEQQSEGVKETIKRLHEQIQAFELTKQKAEQDINARKTELFLQERTLLAREETVNRTDQALKEIGLRLEDERGTLDRAWKEYIRLKDKISP